MINEIQIFRVSYQSPGRCRFIGNAEEFFFTSDLGDKPGDLKVPVQNSANPGGQPDLLLLLRKVTEDGYVDVTVGEMREFTVHQEGANGTGTAFGAKKSRGKMDIDYNPVGFSFEVICR